MLKHSLNHKEENIVHFNTHAIRKIYPKFHNSSDKKMYFAKAWTFLNDNQIMFAQKYVKHILQISRKVLA